MSNANEARQVVFELFQDLDGFSLDDYEPYADIDAGKDRVLSFLRTALESDGGHFVPMDDGHFRIDSPEYGSDVIYTLDREHAQADDRFELMGVDHPILTKLLHRWRELSPEGLGAVASAPDQLTVRSILTVWFIQSFGHATDTSSHIVPIAIDRSGQRLPSIEKRMNDAFMQRSTTPLLDPDERFSLLNDLIEPMLDRELKHRGIASTTGGHSSELIAWLEIVPKIE